MSPKRPRAEPAIELEPDEDTVTIGELLAGLVEPDEPTLPGFEMADEPLPSPAVKSYIEATNERAQTQDIYGKPMPKPEPKTPEPKIIEGEILSPSRPGNIPRYESRIRILDAWQYTGAVHTAPDYVDRNWIGWAGEYDRLRKLEPGPCIRVPVAGDESAVVLCRVGDYVVHEEILGDDGSIDVKIEVWEQEQFNRLFLPKSG
jgi:hypothetical protein